MNDTPPVPERHSTHREVPSERVRLWPWFVAGFSLVFVGMSIAVTMYPMLPSGRGVVACPLWRYYLIELRRVASSSGALGPASGSTTAALVTALQHLLCSSLGGALMLGIGWAKSRRRAP